MSCRHDLANTTCSRCYPDRGGLDSNGLAQIDPGPGPHAPNLDGPGAAPPHADEEVASIRAAVAALTAERDAAVEAVDAEWKAHAKNVLGEAMEKSAQILAGVMRERDAARSERDAANRTRESQWKELQAARADAAAMMARLENCKCGQ